MNANLDENLLNDNVTFVKQSGIGVDMFIHHVSLMLDIDLKEKIGMLFAVGKEPIDIYLNPSILEKYTKENLKDAIAALRKNGMDPKNVPLMAY